MLDLFIGVVSFLPRCFLASVVYDANVVNVDHKSDVFVSSINSNDAEVRSWKFANDNNDADDYDDNNDDDNNDVDVQFFYNFKQQKNIFPKKLSKPSRIDSSHGWGQGDKKSLKSIR